MTVTILYEVEGIPSGGDGGGGDMRWAVLGIAIHTFNPTLGRQQQADLNLRPAWSIKVSFNQPASDFSLHRTHAMAVKGSLLQPYCLTTGHVSTSQASAQEARQKAGRCAFLGDQGKKGPRQC